MQLEPDHLEAWQLLADWEEAAGNAEAALAATEVLVRLTPHRAVAPLWFLPGVIATDG